MSTILVPIESVFATSYLSPVVTMVLTCTVFEMSTYWLKIAYFCYSSLIRRPRSLRFLCNVAMKLTVRKLESWGYPSVKTA